MRTRTVRGLTAALVIGSAAFGFAPLAYGSTETSITPTVEAWYQPNPTCLLPTGCVTTGSLPVAPPVDLPSLPAISPYPAGTLHVGVTGGMESARSYLRFPFEQLDGKAVTSATLEIPLDANPQNGTTMPESSKVAVCATSSSNIVVSEGTIDAPPPVDCTVSVVMKYVATPQPHLQATLGQIAADLPGITGLVLLPDAKTITQSDAWSVAFSAHNRADAAKTAPAKVTVSYEDGTTDSSTDGFGSSDGGTTDTPAVENPGTGVVSNPGTGFASVPEVIAPNDTAVPPSVTSPTSDAPAGTTTQPQLVTVGYAYPAVWLLPLAFLVLVPVVARALTKDLSGEGQ